MTPETLDPVIGFLLFAEFVLAAAFAGIAIDGLTILKNTKGFMDAKDKLRVWTAVGIGFSYSIMEFVWAYQQHAQDIGILENSIWLIIEAAMGWLIWDGLQILEKCAQHRESCWRRVETLYPKDNTGVII